MRLGSRPIEYLNATAVVLRKCENDKRSSTESKSPGECGSGIIDANGPPGESAGKASDSIIALSHDAHTYGARFVAITLPRSLKQKCVVKLKSFFKQKQMEK